MAQKSYRHRGAETPLLGDTIPAHFAAVAQRFAEREAVVSIPQKRRLSYAELSHGIDRLAAGLLGLGFGKGDRIGIWSTSNIEWLLLQLGVSLFISQYPQPYKARHASQKGCRQHACLGHQQEFRLPGKT